MVQKITDNLREVKTPLGETNCEQKTKTEIEQTDHTVKNFGKKKA